MLHIEVKTNGKEILRVRNDKDTAILLSTLPKECHWMVFQAVEQILNRYYNPEERAEILTHMAASCANALEADEDADAAVDEALREKGILPARWRVLREKKP